MPGRQRGRQERARREPDVGVELGDLPLDQELVEGLQPADLEGAASDGASRQHERDLGVLRRPGARAPLDQRQPHAPPIPSPSAAQNGDLSRSTPGIVGLSLPHAPIERGRAYAARHRSQPIATASLIGPSRDAFGRARSSSREPPVSSAPFATPIPELGQNPTDPARVARRGSSDDPTTEPRCNEARPRRTALRQPGLRDLARPGASQRSRSLGSARRRAGLDRLDPAARRPMRRHRRRRRAAGRPIRAPTRPIPTRRSPTTPTAKKSSRRPSRSAAARIRSRGAPRPRSRA